MVLLRAWFQALLGWIYSRSYTRAWSLFLWCGPLVFQRNASVNRFLHSKRARNYALPLSSIACPLISLFSSQRHSNCHLVNLAWSHSEHAQPCPQPGIHTGLPTWTAGASFPAHVVCDALPHRLQLLQPTWTLISASLGQWDHLDLLNSNSLSCSWEIVSSWRAEWSWGSSHEFPLSRVAVMFCLLSTT